MLQHPQLNVDRAGAQQSGIIVSPSQRRSSCCFSSKSSYRPKPTKPSGSCNCPNQTPTTSALSCLGVCLLILIYTIAGAFIFLAIEGTLSFQREETSVAASKPNLSASEGGSEKDLRSRTVDKLWSITEDLNILYKENWTRLAARELLQFQQRLERSRGITGYTDSRSLSTHRWTFSTSFLYSLTLITTIGYGNVTPRTSAGKIVTIVYAFIGIPLVLIYLSTLGDALARSLRHLYSIGCGFRKPPPPVKDCAIPIDKRKSTVFSKAYYGEFSSDLAGRGTLTDHRTPFQAALNLDNLRPYPPQCRERKRVSVILCLLILALYVVIGSFIFNKMENWSLLDSAYFCFVSLTTIGFGDLSPGLYASYSSAQAEDIAICVCSAYILIGMAVVAMCFNLIQEEVARMVRGFNQICGGNTKTHAVRACVPERGGEEIAMAIVS